MMAAAFEIMGAPLTFGLDHETGRCTLLALNLPLAQGNTMNTVTRTCLVLLSLSLLAGPAMAQGAAPEDTIDGIIQCARIPDRDRRLACYDQRVNDLVIGIQSGTVRAEPLAAPDQPRKTAAKEAEKKRPFWALWGLKKKPETQDQNLEMRTQLVSHSVDPLGRYIFRLANGQVWKQKSARTLVIKDGEEVVVKPGVLGSFHLTVGRNPPVRVTRIK